ncbi:hypothetical protein [Spirosoma sp. KNUC1025]|uniref:hypothetical protein n=1 Tax=Spirosoma sp. KNUC1025 TaxID=2894082 RepID=UPI003868CBE5|nr:hypothetical protein LN737_05085 [Spirosoma sp. KNUC1025]
MNPRTFTQPSPLPVNGKRPFQQQLLDWIAAVQQFNTLYQQAQAVLQTPNSYPLAQTDSSELALILEQMGQQLAAFVKELDPTCQESFKPLNPHRLGLHTQRMNVLSEQLKCKLVRVLNSELAGGEQLSKSVYEYA